jgi:glutathione peroxidase
MLHKISGETFIMPASIYEIPVAKITGEPASLAEFKGDVLLIVNTASQCVFTTQYEGLEKLYDRFRERGFVVAGFPANDFKEQEPGTNDEIHSFCTLTYGVKFPMFAKIAVAGGGKHPLYAALIAAQPDAISVGGNPFRQQLKGWGVPTTEEPEISWNFEKFIVSRSGEVVKRFAPETAPDAPELVAAIEDELAKN